MDHQEAIRTHAAERYTLGEMSAPDRDEYEAHFFTCERCAEEVVGAAAFADNARAALIAGAGRPEGARDAAPGLIQEKPQGWLTALFGVPVPRLLPALGALSLVLVAVAAYQNVALIPGLRRELAVRNTAQAVPTVALRTAVRGNGPQLTVSSADAYAVLQVDVIPERPVSTYLVTLTTAAGAEPFRTSLAAPPLGVPVMLLVPVRDLAPGGYTLVMRDEAGGAEIGRFAFTLERN